MARDTGFGGAEFHYPAELIPLLVDTIPLLFRSKRDVIDFFRGAGVSQGMLADLAQRVRTDKDNITKYEIVRIVLTRVNEGRDATLRQRREILKRVVEFEQFESCWETDRLKAQGLVAQVQRLVNVKDAFTRMNVERDQERQQRMAAKEAEAERARTRKATLDSIRADLAALFSEQNAQKRGKALEGVLNRMCSAYGLLVREGFELRTAADGVVEQIDGVIEVHGTTYIVEMKWLKELVGPKDIGLFLTRVYGRADVGGIFISTSNYSPGAMEHVNVAVAQRTIVLVKLEEIVLLLDRGGDLKEFLKRKIEAARIERRPFLEIRS